MFLRRLSIQWKITLLAGLCLLGVVALLVGPFGLPHAAQQRAGEKRQYTDARRIGAPAPGSPRGNCRRYASSAISRMPSSTARASPGRSCSSATRAQKRFLDAYDLREDLTRQVRTALAANPEVLGLYVVFEPNALDGKDELFVDQPALGSNDKGRFSLYWAQATPGQLESESMIGPNSPTPAAGPAARPTTPGTPARRKAGNPACSILTSTRSANANC